MTDSPSAIVDAHVHLWDTSRFTLPWLANVPELAARYTAEDLAAAVGELGVRSAIAVQAGDSPAEAAWLFDATDGAALGRRAFRVVLQYAPAEDGWLGAVQSAVDQNAALPAGIRLPVHRGGSDWTELPGLETLARRLEDEGMVLELLLRPDQIAVVHELALAHPRLHIVLCHLGLGAGAPTAEWRSALARLTRTSNVFAKISGLFSPAGTRKDGDIAARDAIGAAFEALGPARLIFGSDWPMSTRVGTYSEVVERTSRILPELTAGESEAIWGSTATHLYEPLSGGKPLSEPFAQSA
jgi:L-fuconolactonase